uniref:3,9-dihydroxypterocarpan 6A-monooxygenase n=1 Tax=Noccaea caerulescens TaxID=107243 RepID=A0A1J3CD99_NOCCA
MVTMNLDNNYTLCSYLFFTFITIFLLHRLFRYSSSRRHVLPPGPRGLPVLGHMHLLRSSIPRSLQALAHKYGPLMTVRIGSVQVLVVSDSDTAKQILKTHDPDFASKFVFGPRQFNVYKGAEFFNAPYGPYWRFMKKLCMTKLFAGYQLDRFVDIRKEETLALLRSLVEKSSNGEACDLGLEFTALTTKILSRMVMGKRCVQNSNLPIEIRKVVSDIMTCATRFGFLELFGPFRDWDVFGNGKRLRSSIWRYDDLVEKVLKEYEDDKSKNEGEKDTDIVDILLDTYNDPKAELKLTMNQIKFFILELFMASLDTTSAALQWTMTELINHQDILAKIREEIESVLRKNTHQLIKESDLQKLPYLQAAIKETLRLHPVGPLLRRESNRDMKINGYDVKSGTKIFVNAYGIMRDPNTYKDPDKFIPERFLAVEENTERKIGYYQQQYLLELKGQDVNYLAFGSGRRGCLGASHASLVLSLTIGSLVQCFDWKVIGDEDKIKIKLPNGFSASGTAGGSSLMCSPDLYFDPFGHQT